MPQLNAASTDSHRYAIQASDSAVDAPAAGYVRDFYKSTGAYVKDENNVVYPVRTYKREIVVSASQMWPSTTAGSAALAQTELGTNKVNYKSLDFDQTTQEHAEFTLLMPDDWNASTITYKVWWTAAAGSAAQTVEWDLQARAFANDDAFDGAWGTAIEVSDALIATGDIHVTSESAALTIANTPAAGELVQFRIYRDVNDTLAADAKLLAVKLYFY